MYVSIRYTCVHQDNASSMHHLSSSCSALQEVYVSVFLSLGLSLSRAFSLPRSLRLSLSFSLFYRFRSLCGYISIEQFVPLCIYAFLCGCVFVSRTHTHIHVHARTYTRTNTLTNTHTHTCARTQTYTYTLTHVHVVPYTHTHIHNTHMRRRARTRAHTHTHTHTHTHAHTRTHTHKHTHSHTPTHTHTHTHKFTPTQANLAETYSTRHHNSRSRCMWLQLSLRMVPYVWLNSPAGSGANHAWVHQFHALTLNVIATHYTATHWSDWQLQLPLTPCNCHSLSEWQLLWSGSWVATHYSPE